MQITDIEIGLGGINYTSIFIYDKFGFIAIVEELKITMLSWGSKKMVFKKHFLPMDVESESASVKSKKLTSVWIMVLAKICQVFI